MTTGTELDRAARSPFNPGGVVDLANVGGGLEAVADMSQTIAWAQRLAVLLPVFEAVVETPFVPDSYWPMPAGVSRSSGWPPQLKHRDETDEQFAMRRRSAAGSCAVAAMWGEAYGWDPPRSWRGLYVVHGRVNLYAEAVNDLCRRRHVGLEVVKREADEAVIRLRRPEDDAEWHTYSFTMADAEAAGYVPGRGRNQGKNGGNEKYLTDPKTMLYARALTIGARIEIPDILGGAGIAETADDEPMRVEVTATPAHLTAEQIRGRGEQALAAVLAGAERAGSSTSSGDGEPPAAQPAAEPAPPAEPVGDEQPPPDPEPAKASGTTLAAISARFRELGGRTAGGDGAQVLRRRVIGSMVDRPVERASDLTQHEADLVLNTLQATTPELLAALADRIDPPKADQ